MIRLDVSLIATEEEGNILVISTELDIETLLSCTATVEACTCLVDNIGLPLLVDHMLVSNCLVSGSTLLVS